MRAITYGPVSARPLQNTTMVPTNPVGATLAVARIAGGGKPLPYIQTDDFLLTL